MEGEKSKKQIYGKKGKGNGNVQKGRDKTENLPSLTKSAGYTIETLNITLKLSNLNNQLK